MRKPAWRPGDALWSTDSPLLYVDKTRYGLFSIDGIENPRGSASLNQLLIVSKGSRLLGELGKEFGLLYRIGDHLGFDPSDWRFSCRFLIEYIKPFLYQFRDLVVSVQVLPCRRTFRTMFAQGNPHPPQKAATATFPFHAACIRNEQLTLAYNFKIDGRDLLMGTVDDYEERDHGPDAPYWTQVEVRRILTGGFENREYWFFVAHEWERQHIQTAVSVPVLERTFHNDIQHSPLVSFCAFRPSGLSLQSHCFSLDRSSGLVLDIRQSRPSLEHHCRSAPHNHSGLGKLVCGERWEWNS